MRGVFERLREREEVEREREKRSKKRPFSPGSFAQLLWHAAACSLMRAASLASALGRGVGIGGQEEGGEGGERLQLQPMSRRPAVAAAAAAAQPSGSVEAEVEDAAGGAAAAKAAASASSLSFACFTELKRPLALKDAGARQDILTTFFSRNLIDGTGTGEKKEE